MKKQEFAVSIVFLLVTIFPGCIFLLSSPRPGLCTASLQPTADAYVAQNNPTVNYGSEVSLIVSPGLKAVCRSLVKFDLTQIPPAQSLPALSLSSTWLEPGMLPAGGRMNATCWIGTGLKEL
ncbi:MAG: DUF7594 domain-containing protein [Thermoproteota archaeon]